MGREGDEVTYVWLASRVGVDKASLLLARGIERIG
jgi:hypothetical protein